MQCMYALNTYLAEPYMRVAIRADVRQVEYGVYDSYILIYVNQLM